MLGSKVWCKGDKFLRRMGVEDLKAMATKRSDCKAIPQQKCKNVPKIIREEKCENIPKLDCVQVNIDLCYWFDL